MTNPLKDKLLNDYSTEYVLVVGEDSYYHDYINPFAISFSTYESKINISNTAAPIPSKVDPLRQAIGKFWTYQEGSMAGVQMYDTYANLANDDNFVEQQQSGKVFIAQNYYNKLSTVAPTSIKVEDSTQIWSSLFPAGSFPQTLDLRRKATRMKIQLNSNDVIQNRLTMLSFLSDIFIKNQPKAFINTKAGDLVEPKKEDSGVLSPEEFVELELEKIELEKLIKQIEAILSFAGDLQEENIYQGKWYSYTGPGSYEEIVALNYPGGVSDDAAIYGEGQIDIDLNYSLYVSKMYKPDGKYLPFGFTDLEMTAAIFKLLDEFFLYPNALTGLQFDVLYDNPNAFGDGGLGVSFFTWLEKIKLTTIPGEIQEISDKQAQSSDDQFDYAEALQLFYDQQNAYLTFLPGNIDYNYDAALKKEDIPIVFALGDANSSTLVFGDFEEGQKKKNYEKYLEPLMLQFLTKRIKDSRLNSFYDTSTETYAYDDSVSGRYYRDTNFSMNLPMGKEELSLVSAQDKTQMYVDITPTYNYYSRYYEKATVLYDLPTKETSTINQDSLKLKETCLPIIYEVPLENDASGIANPSPNTEDNISSGQYGNKFQFEKFGHTLLNCLATAPALWSIYSLGQDKQNFNILIDQTDKQFLDKYNNIKTQFPFHVGLEFSTDPNNEFANLFHQGGMIPPLIQTLISNFFYFQKEGTLNTEPTKDEIISEKFTYYNNEDPSSDTLIEGLGQWASAPICTTGIYKIEAKKQFYKSVAPTTTEYANLLESGVYEVGTNPDETIGDVGATNVRELDLNKWINSYISSIFLQEQFADQEGFGTGAATVEQFLGTSLANASMKIINTNTLKDPTLPSVMQFIPEYGSLVDKYMRNYYELLDRNNLAYNETLFYRIQKVAVDADGNVDEGGLVQNFWLVKPKQDSGKDLMKYIDTQVRYGQRYEYTVYAYQIVVGTKYGFQFENANVQGPVSQDFDQYKDNIDNSAQLENAIPSNESDDLLYLGEDGFSNHFYKKQIASDTEFRLAIFDVVCEADVKLVEMPFYKKTVAVTDAPPAFPEVDIVPLKGKENNIKINFYPGSIGTEAKPVEIDIQKDAPIFLKIRQAQGRDVLKQEYAWASKKDTNAPDELQAPSYYVQPKIKFKSDDFVTNYEIYRIDTPPASYTAFKDNMIFMANPHNQSSFTDEIEQNKKYYYTFRSIDVHGNISNPSPIYQVELVENSGAVYPVISIYEFEQQSNNTKTKSFRRLMKISAAPQQAELDFESSVFSNPDSATGIETVMLGTSTDKLFNQIDSGNKKFKFRIRSKHTGKVVDLNVKFKVRKAPFNQTAPSCGDEGYIEYNMPEAGSDVLHEGAGSDNTGNDEGHSW